MQSMQGMQGADLHKLCAGAGQQARLGLGTPGVKGSGASDDLVAARAARAKAAKAASKQARPFTMHMHVHVSPQRTHAISVVVQQHADTLRLLQQPTCWTPGLRHAPSESSMSQRG